MKFTYRPRILDVIIFVAGIAAVVLVAALVYSGKGGTLYVHITSPEGEWIEPLDKDREIGAGGPLGTTFVHIEGGAAAITDSPCKNKLCISMGAISLADQWIACLPNKVFVRIEGGAKKDAVDAAAF